MAVATLQRQAGPQYPAIKPGMMGMYIFLASEVMFFGSLFAVRPGVRGIADDIEIFTDIEAEDVTELVQDALFRYGLLAGDSDIRVDASDGTITLAGNVLNWTEHDAVIDAAWRGVGVKNVRDELVITG